MQNVHCSHGSPTTETRHGKWAVCQEVAGGAGRRGAQTGGAPSSLTPPPVGSKGQGETPPHPGVLSTGHHTKCSYSFPTSHTPSTSINVETTLPGLYRCIPRPHLLSEVSTVRQVSGVLMMEPRTSLIPAERCIPARPDWEEELSGAIQASLSNGTTSVYTKW